jgi:pancreatic triacylglycerol lipase
VIHSDGASNLHIGLGLLEKSGTIDFYPNGGRDQTNCAAVKDKIITGLINIVTLNIDELEDISGCSHVAAYKFFIDSIENPSCYTSYPCSSIEEFKLGNCIECSKKGCNKMGYWADPSKDSGDLYLTTQVNSIFF